MRNGWECLKEFSLCSTLTGFSPCQWWLFLLKVVGVAPLLIPQTQGGRRMAAGERDVLVEAGVGPVGGVVAVRC